MADETLEQIVDLLEPRHSLALADFVTEAGSADFRVHWLADEVPLMCAELYQLYDYWRGLPCANAVPSMADFRPEELAPILGNLHLLEEQPEDGNLVYRLYGSCVAERYGVDRTGEILPKDAKGMVLLFHGIYRVVMRDLSAVYTSHEPPAASNVKDCQRLILPMTNRGNDKRSLLVGHFPKSVPRSSPAAHI